MADQVPGDPSDAAAELHRRQRALLARELVAGQRTQRLIADRLHDGPLQILISLGLRLELASGDADDAGVGEELRGLAGHVQAGVVQLRDLILDLDSLVGHRGLANAVRSLAQSYEAVGGWDTSLDVDDGVDEVPEEVAFVVERLVQAVLTEARDHAKPSHLTVELHRRDADLVVTIAHDGEPGALAGDDELVLAEERIRAIDGTLSLTDGDTRSRITAVVPVGTDRPA